MIRAADIASTENRSEWTPYLRIGQRRWWEHEEPKGIIFRLVPTQRPHEYYIQRLEDGQYLSMKYKGIIGGGHWDDCDLFTTPTSCHCNYGKVQRVQGEIWLPVESNLISNPSSIDPSILVLREEDYNERDFLPPKPLYFKPEPEGIEIGQIGDLRIGRPVPDGTLDVEYEKKRKSKKRRRGKKRKHNYGNWKSNDKLRKKVIERKSRKYGLISKYELYL